MCSINTVGIISEFWQVHLFLFIQLVYKSFPWRTNLQRLSDCSLPPQKTDSNTNCQTCTPWLDMFCHCLLILSHKYWVIHRCLIMPFFVQSVIWHVSYQYCWSLIKCKELKICVKIPCNRFKNLAFFLTVLQTHCFTILYRTAVLLN